MTEPTKVTVILSGPDDRWIWFYTVKGLAKSKLVWEYIDPDAKEENLLAIPTRPKMPVYKDLGDNIISFEQVVEMNKIFHWEEMNRVYDRKRAEYLEIRDALEAMRTHILESVNRHTLRLLKADSIREMISILRDSYQPNTAFDRLK